MNKVKVAYQLFKLNWKKNCNKVANKTTYHPSFNTFYHPYICVDGVPKIV